eukprot:362013-Pleurochrysis_carterae.AAC.1
MSRGRGALAPAASICDGLSAQRRTHPHDGVSCAARQGGGSGDFERDGELDGKAGAAAGGLAGAGRGADADGGAAGADLGRGLGGRIGGEVGDGIGGRCGGGEGGLSGDSEEGEGEEQGEERPPPPSLFSLCVCWPTRTPNRGGRGYARAAKSEPVQPLSIEDEAAADMMSVITI